MSKPDRTTLASQIEDCFQQPIPPIRKSFTYKIATALVAMAMIALPMIYFSIVLLVGYLVQHHMLQNLHLLRSPGGKVGVLAYGAPLVVGVVLVFFMLKPIFSRAPKPPKNRTLSRAEHPLLFEAIGLLCRSMKAPEPKEVCVDLEVNASASFRRGIWSMFGSDLTLTIGLPLLQGLSARELVGVLSHEFGHFAQGAGMRLSYLIRSVHLWFVRVVYERDKWDEMVHNASQDGHWITTIVFMVARLFLWITRQVLKLLMLLANLISSYLMRQMEFDADQYEIRVAGSETFKRTADKLVFLSLASQKTIGDLENEWQAERLADDLPAMLLANYQRFPQQMKQAVRSDVAEQATGLFDSHPSFSARNERADAANSPGIFSLTDPRAGRELPATVLLSEFDALSKSSSLAYYKEQLTSDIDERNLVSTSELMNKLDFQQQADGAVSRLFQDSLHIGRLPIFQELGDPEAGSDPQIKTELDGLLRAVLAQSDQLKEPMLAFREAFQRVEQLELAAIFSEHKIRIDNTAFLLDKSDIDSIRQALQQAESEKQRLAETLIPLDQVCTALFHYGLRLSLREETRQQLEDIGADTNELLNTVRALRAHIGEILKLQRVFSTVMNVVEIYNETQDESTLHRLDNLMKVAYQQLKQLKPHFTPLNYPFQHARDNVSVGDYLAERIPSPGDYNDLIDATGGFINQAQRNVSTKMRQYDV